MTTGIEHVAIMSKDSAALKNWYTQIFGTKVVYDNGKGTFFLAFEDGSMIEIINSSEVMAKEGHLATGLRHIALNTTKDGFDAMIEKVKASGVEIVAEKVEAPNGNMTFFFRDIDGNVLHLMYRPVALCSAT